MASGIDTLNYVVNRRALASACREKRAVKSTPIGAAIIQNDGRLALVVSHEWRERLLALLAAEGRPVERVPVPHRADCKIVTEGREDDILRWTTKVSRL